ncbi:hypothetical protein FWH13_01360 [Candidatus Saccharibacteria bacterium]|nr:hypothetical protein [Candidatus Saccharibacteria bacterium]
MGKVKYLGVAGLAVALATAVVMVGGADVSAATFSSTHQVINANGNMLVHPADFAATVNAKQITNITIRGNIGQIQDTVGAIAYYLQSINGAQHEVNAAAMNVSDADFANPEHPAYIADAQVRSEFIAFRTAMRRVKTFTFELNGNNSFGSPRLTNLSNSLRTIQGLQGNQLSLGVTVNFVGNVTNTLDVSNLTAAPTAQQITIGKITGFGTIQANTGSQVKFLGLGNFPNGQAVYLNTPTANETNNMVIVRGALANSAVIHAEDGASTDPKIDTHSDAPRDVVIVDLNNEDDPNTKTVLDIIGRHEKSDLANILNSGLEPDTFVLSLDPMGSYSGTLEVTVSHLQHLAGSRMFIYKFDMEGNIIALGQTAFVLPSGRLELILNGFSGYILSAVQLTSAGPAGPDNGGGGGSNNGGNTGGNTGGGGIKAPNTGVEGLEDVASARTFTSGQAEIMLDASADANLAVAGLVATLGAAAGTVVVRKKKA